jgi:AsmA protein
MRALKISGIVLGCLVAAFFLLLFAVWLFVNPNDYKGRIEQDVKSSTGRDLVLGGPLRLSVFPWVALQLGPASLGNPPGFGSGPFASIRYASLSVKLLPLLRKQLEIGRVEVDGLDLNLMRNARGEGNWQFGNATAAPAPASQSGGAGEELGNVAGVVIKNSRISYQGMAIEKLNADLGQVRAAAPVPVSLKLELITHAGAEPIGLSAKLDLTRSASGEQYRIERLSLDGTWIPKPRAASVPWGFSAPSMSLDLAAQTASAPSFAAEVATAHLTGSLQGSRVVDAPNVTGTFRLEPVVLRQWMSEMALPVPDTRDPKALSRFAASGDFAYGGNAARAEKLDVELDDSTLRGDAAITNLTSDAMTFDLALDHIDLDRYMSAAAAPAAPAAARAPQRQPTELPTSSLKSLQLSGTASIGQATVERLKVTQVRVKLDASGGVLHVEPASAQLYGGTYAGRITLDARGSVPALSLDQSLTGIDVGPLLKDFDNINRLSGRGNVTTQLAGRGATSDAVLKTLSGRVTANLTNGAVEGLDLWYEINRAVALAQRRPMPAGKDTARTAFTAFKASADLKDGIATTRDLEIASQDLRVTGQGTANLVTDAIDYRVKAEVLKGAAGGMLANIPLNITGTLTSPSVRPDLAELAKAGLQQALKGRKQELQQTLQNKLKSLLR